MTGAGHGGGRVGYERRGELAFVTLDRPDKLNAIDAAMVRGLHEALDRAEGDDAVRAIVLTGAGKAFSAGFDLAAGDTKPTDDEVRRTLTADFDIIMRFWDCPKPTVAAVHRYCLGSALELAVACDVTIAADDCLFGEPEVQFGSGIVALLLPWFIGPKLAKELLLTGDDRIPAARALEIGLVNRVVPAASLADEAVAMARRIAGNDPFAVRLTKLAINRSMDIAGMRSALAQALEIDVTIETTETPESREFNAILARDGAKAAIAWRRARSGSTGPATGSDR
ncbi:MAG: enoyl-CoA hydratase/isomerase family protein [Gammaproteobacteria bacterium]|nr:enoyl-CoA hydratase/isomerase family protein [Gammaproteobacteria bacterium]